MKDCAHLGLEWKPVSLKGGIMGEQAYIGVGAGPREMEHGYGPYFHLLNEPVAWTRLARVCRPEVVQPEFGAIIEGLYDVLFDRAMHALAPRSVQRIETRMAEYVPGAAVEGELIDPSTKIAVCDIARAGMVPAQRIYKRAHELFEQPGIRQDHVYAARIEGEDGHVVGTSLAGSKIGGDVNGRMVIFPDPMGATGSSMCQVVSHYKSKSLGEAQAFIALHLIVTPEYLRKVHAEHPNLHVFALRLDRGASKAGVYESGLGEFPELESGLTSTDYILPGGGGFGEVMNNSFV